MEYSHDQKAGKFRRIVQIQLGLKTWRRTTTFNRTGRPFKKNPTAFLMAAVGVVGLRIMPCFLNSLPDCGMIQKLCGRRGLHICFTPHPALPLTADHKGHYRILPIMNRANKLDCTRVAEWVQRMGTYPLRWARIHPSQLSKLRARPGFRTRWRSSSNMG